MERAKLYTIVVLFVGQVVKALTFFSLCKYAGMVVIWSNRKTTPEDI